MKREAVSPPQDNSQWLEWLAYIRDEADLAVLEEICRGRISASSPFFCEQLVRTAELALRRSAKQFSREINERLEFGEIESLIVPFRRFRRDVARIKLLAGIGGLEEEIALQLRESVSENAGRVWAETLRILSAQARESHSAAIEDTIRRIKRLNLS